MLTVATIIARKGASAVAVTPDTKVVDALRTMSEKNIGSILVMDGGEYLGIFTERDYARKIVLKGKSSLKTHISEIMRTDLPSVSTSDSVAFCMQLMTDKNIRYLTVFEKERLIGIVSMSDVVKETILSQQETINYLDSYIHSK